MTVHTGKHFLQIPGPTNVPDRVLRAMDMPTMDHRGAEFAEIGFAVYYQPPLHLQPALAYLGYAEGDFPETEKASRENLCLPLWAGIAEEQQAEVVSVLRRASELVPR